MATRLCKKDRCPLYSGGTCRHIREVGAPDGFQGRTFRLCEREREQGYKHKHKH